MEFVKPKDIGPGNMSWTIVFQELNGDVTSTLAAGSHDKSIVWEQAQSFFYKRVLAILPGNHQVVTKKDMS
jgi:hypothetical protein